MESGPLVGQDSPCIGTMGPCEITLPPAVMSGAVTMVRPRLGQMAGDWAMGVGWGHLHQGARHRLGTKGQAQGPTKGPSPSFGQSQYLRRQGEMKTKTDRQTRVCRPCPLLSYDHG